MKLYEATEALAIVDELLIEADGEMSPEIEELLTQAEGDFAVKVERVALKIRELSSTAAAVKEEADRLAARATSSRKSADALKDYLHRQMLEAGESKIVGKLVTIAVQNSPAAVHSTLDAAGLQALALEYPAFVIHVPASLRLDSRAVLTSAQAGADVPAGIAITQSTHLRIR